MQHPLAQFTVHSQSGSNTTQRAYYQQVAALSAHTTYGTEKAEAKEQRPWSGKGGHCWTILLLVLICLLLSPKVAPHWPQCQEWWCHPYMKGIWRMYYLFSGKSRISTWARNWLVEPGKVALVFIVVREQSRLHFLCMAKICVVWTSTGTLERTPSPSYQLAQCGTKKKNDWRACWWS